MYTYGKMMTSFGKNQLIQATCKSMFYGKVYLTVRSQRASDCDVSRLIAFTECRHCSIHLLLSVSGPGHATTQLVQPRLYNGRTDTQ
jgi:hypothetical protein